MGKITVTQNSSAIINLPTDYTDNGWTISEGIAIHGACNSGIITSNILTDGKEYVVSYEVLNRTSGSVYTVSGANVGVPRSNNGLFTETITADGSQLGFYSNGNLSLANVKVYESSQDDNYITIAFSEKLDKWVTYYSYVPEMMIKFINGFFTTKSGELWEHNTNEVRNSFYNQPYPSQITFYVNINPSTIKQYWSIRLKSNKVWSADVSILPTEGKSKGMRSRLKATRFKSLQGDWFADFLRNMDDPRFLNEVDALFKGDQLQGSVMKVTITNNDTTEVRLLQVDVMVSTKNYTY